jgi:hypothetical protein
VKVVRVVNTFFAQQGGTEGGGTPARVIADDRSNSVLVGGDKSIRLRITALITHLDTPLDNGGDTQVRYLQFADAEKIAAKLKEQVSATVAITGGAPTAGGAGGSVAASADRSTTIWAEPETNALVITAPQKVMRSLMSVVDRLDIRRMQVLVEAIIVDVRVDKNAELGVNWAAWSQDSDTRIPIGGFIPARRRRESRDARGRGRQSRQCALPACRRHDVRYRPHRRHRRELRGDAARHSGRLDDQRHCHPIRGDHGQPGSRAQGGARSAVHHRLVLEHRQQQQ